MILTNCAACAAPLPRLAKQCSRCQTRYCHATCQQDHWRRGHKQMCKKIFRGGGAEKYLANKKYKEAVAVAVVIESLRRALTEQLDWSLDDLGSKLDGVDAVEMKFIYAFYDLVSGTVCDSPEALARDVKKLVSDFEEEGGLAQYQ